MAFPPGAVTLPRLALDDVCMEESADGWVCTRAAGHTGRHAACGLGGRLIEVWPNTDPLSSRTRERGGRARTPASPSFGEDGGDAGTNAPNTETGAGGG